MSSKRKAHPLENLSFDPPAPTSQPAPTSLGKEEPAPTPQEDPTRSSNVTLPASIWEWVDAKHAQARSAGGAAFRKSAIMRAVFLVAMSADVDIAGSQSDEEIAEKIIRAIAQQNNRTVVQ